MDDVLTLPLAMAEDAGRMADGMPANLQDAKRLVSDAIAVLAARGASLDPVDASVARLLLKSGASVDQTACWIADWLGARIGSEGTADEGGWGRVLYRAAGDALADERISEAITLLAALMPLRGGRGEALLGLAVCAARLSQFDDALVLALASRDSGVGHPRASFLAGLCELERGNRRAAQSYLATAARLARGRSDCRDDLRQAQRRLLLMHLA